jgi:hypothetical protein
MPTSVDNLSPGSPYVKIANSLPFRSGVHLHSIIGNKEGKPLTDPECSDGFVPYSSSHLDNVDSEFLVRSDSPPSSATTWCFSRSRRTRSGAGTRPARRSP